MGGKKKTREQITIQFDQSGCKLLTEKYTGVNQKLKYKCKCGNIAYTILRGKTNIQCFDCGRKQATQTNKNNHGGKFYCDVEGRKKRWLEKYGVDNPLKSKEIREKRKRTNLKKYGVEHVFQSDDVKNKSKQTFLNKYGVEYPQQSSTIREKTKQSFLDKYGVPGPTFMMSSASKESQKLFWAIQEKLPMDIQIKSHFAELNGEFVKKKDGEEIYFKYDFVNSMTKTCIEYNGSRFHPRVEQNDDEINWCVFHPKKTVKESREYEHTKKETIEKYGYTILIIWDFDIKQNGFDNMVDKCAHYITKRGK